MSISKKIIIPLFCVMFSLVSCEKTLNEDPQSIIAPDAFFKTVDQCRQATNGVYSHLPGLFNQKGFWAVTMAGTDLFMNQGGTTTIRAIQDYNFSSATEENSHAVWRVCYAAIKDANFVISRISASEIDEKVKNELLGESKFLRAMYYYILTNTFGDVPVWTEELNMDEVAQLPRSPIAEVRGQMILDLQEAIASLPANYDSNNTGRVTKGAALTLLAKIYLFDKNWQQAYDTALQVKDGEYILLPSYAELFDPSNKSKNNQESIFEIQYARNAETNQNFIVNSFYSWFFPTGDASGGTYAGVDFGTILLQSYPQYYPSNHLISLYALQDERREVSLSWGYNGQNFNRGSKENSRPWFGPKFWDLTANRTASEKNFYFLRYADVIMILAEAANELGNTGEAVTYLNMIRQRAKADLASASLSQPQLREEIMEERAREFVGEFQRKWDLSRWNKLTDAMRSVQGDNAAGIKNVKPHHVLFPIPYDEIVKNRNLSQNEGYN
ncbi:MAG: RagB/SusD family nutrient uptake outer membrane protein [Sphingobacterium sp.]